MTAGNEMSGPIFVVGASRSGTELVLALLNRHPEVGVASETHYFDDLRPRVGGGRSVLTPEQREVTRRYFESLRRGWYGLNTTFPSSISVQCSEIKEETADEVFRQYCEAWSAVRGKRIWGEKTPRHIFRGDDILEAFPDARILVLIRDPRAVVASYRDWRNQWADAEALDPSLVEASQREDRRIRASYSLSTVSMLWKSAARHAEGLARRHGPDRVRILKYEDLVTEPERTTRELCEWLGIPFDRDMLMVGVVNSSYVAANAQDGFDPAVAGRWRSVLSANEIGYVDWLVGGVARSFGYAPAGFRVSKAFAARELALVPFRLLRAAVVNRRRIGALMPYLISRARGLM